MQLNRSARDYLLVILLLASTLLAGCGSRPTPTRISSATKIIPVINSATPAPTRTPVNLPPTLTPVPPSVEVEITRTRTPTPTATLNVPQTMEAIATANQSTECKKSADSWQVKLTKSVVKPGWCDLNSIGGLYYEYKLTYPGEWQVITFGDVYPSMAFQTYQKGIELRLYQLYNYSIRKYEGSLDDAPLKAAFCDDKDKCKPVVDPLEKITNKETRAVGIRKVLILDSQDGKYNIRRYFFFVPFQYANPKSNRLFFFKLYTPEPVTSANYQDLEDKIFDILDTIKHNFATR